MPAGADTRPVVVYLQVGDHEKLVAEAAKVGLSVSAYARMVLKKALAE